MNRRALTVANRLDAVAGAVAHFQRTMMMDVDQAAKAMRDEEMLAEIEDFASPLSRRGRLQNIASRALLQHLARGDLGRIDPGTSSVSRSLHGESAANLTFLIRRRKILPSGLRVV
jgi:hypothetical protein